MRSHLANDGLFIAIIEMFNTIYKKFYKSKYLQTNLDQACAKIYRYKRKTQMGNLNISK